MRKSVWRRCSAVLAIVFVGAPATAAAAGPAPINIGNVGVARDINNHGQVAGGSQVGPAWVWKQGTGFTWIPGAAKAVAINDSAMVVGNRLDDDGGPFVWTPASGLVDLATLPGESYRWAWTSDVNDHSQIVGKGRNRLMTDPWDRAITWTPELWMADLDLGTAMATAINDSGQVVGTIGEMGSYSYAGRAFSWTQANGKVDLGILPGGDYSQANAVNNSGQVVGDSGTFFAYNNPNAVPIHAFSWTQAGGMVDLGTLPGATDSYAYGINDRGQVVGKSGGRPFLWSPETGMSELGLVPGDENGSAYAINDQGQVVGVSGGSHAVLWFGDTTQPSARLRVLRGQRLTSMLRGGLQLELTLSEPGTGDVTVSLGSSKGTIAHKSVSFTGPGSTTVTLKVDGTPRVRAARARLRKVSKATLNFRTAARDLAGNSDVITAKVTLKR
jgi:probable HAF family extracellular repeat protein